MEHFEIRNLKDILETFALIITEEREYTPTQEFLGFLATHLMWLNSLDNEMALYDPINKSLLTGLIDFLKDPNPYFKGCIQWMDELIDIKLSFLSLFRVYAYRPLLRLLWPDEFPELKDYFKHIRSELEYILERMPPADYESMHEKNRELYRELNAYILDPARAERISSQYGVDICDYLDAIDV